MQRTIEVEEFFNVEHAQGETGRRITDPRERHLGRMQNPILSQHETVEHHVQLVHRTGEGVSCCHAGYEKILKSKNFK